MQNKKSSKPYGFKDFSWSECNYRISENADRSTVCWQSARGKFRDTLYGNDYTVYGIQSPIQHPADRNSSLQMLEFCIALFMEKTKLIVRKTDRRTVMTKGMIQDALLALLQNTPYEKITVTALCKQSEISLKQCRLRRRLDISWLLDNSLRPYHCFNSSRQADNIF